MTSTPHATVRTGQTSGWRQSSGYSLVEIMIVLGLIATASAIAVVVPPMTQLAKADGEMQRIMSTLRSARDQAVAQRRNVAVQFPSVTQLRLVRQDVANGAVVGTTDLGTTTMESGFDYRLFPAVPDTPDAFGNGAPTAFGNATAVLFSSEGELVDQTGDPVNGTIFIGRVGETNTARAVTILGVTGLITGYRWDGRQWNR
jgi:prepilin-type N-terminal cleavage/methylation domain-containing protein